jgi:hypothetical protein
MLYNPSGKRIDSYRNELIAQDESWYGLREKSPDTQSLRKNLLGALLFQEELYGGLFRTAHRAKKRPAVEVTVGLFFYLSEQITVASCTGQSQCQVIFFDFINQQPIRQDMAFTESNGISG